MQAHQGGSGAFLTMPSSIVVDVEKRPQRAWVMSGSYVER